MSTKDLEEAEEDMTVTARSLATLPQPLTPLQLYESLDSEVPVQTGSCDNPLDVPRVDESQNNCSSFRKEMDVLLCGDTDSQQTETQLSCCSEPQPLASPSFSLQAEDFSIEQGDHIPVNEFPLPEEQHPAPEGKRPSSILFTPVSTETVVSASRSKDVPQPETNAPELLKSCDIVTNTSVAVENVNTDTSDSLSAIESLVQEAEMSTPKYQCNQQSLFMPVSLNSCSNADSFRPTVRKMLNHNDQKCFDGSTFSSKLRAALEDHAKTLQIHNSNLDTELDSLPNFLSMQELSAQPEPIEGDVILTVDAQIIGASGQIKFQRNAGGVKIVFPPTTAEKTVRFDDLINLFSLNEVRQTFCAENKGEGIIQQLLQQGLTELGPPSGRLSSLSQSSSLDFPSLVSPALSVSDSWSWEISRLLDENSSQGDVCDDRSELNTPIVTLPHKQTEESRSGLNTPIVTLPFKLSSDQASNTPLPRKQSEKDHEELNSSIMDLLSTQSDLSDLGSAGEILLPPVDISAKPSSPLLEDFSISPYLRISNSKDVLNSINLPNAAMSMPQRVFTPLQVQIPEETDSPVRMSRTLQSCSTYFEGISLGISPVIDLDPNVATVGMSCPPTTNLPLEPLQKMETSDNAEESVKDEVAGITTLSVDIIVDDGEIDWQKILPDPTEEFIRKVSGKCYQCHLCSNSYRHKFQVQRHIRTQHSTSKQFICAICSAVFSMKYSLNRHMKTHDGVKFECNMCPRKFSRQYHLLEHMKIHTDPGALKCTICGKQSNSRSAYYVHRDICSGMMQTYICDICGKSFLGATSFNHHRSRHLSSKTFKCDLCESPFHTQWQLAKHTKRHHDNRALYSCTFCSIKFYSEGSLSNHECPVVTSKEIGAQGSIKTDPEMIMSSPIAVVGDLQDYFVSTPEGAEEIKNELDPLPLASEKPKKKQVVYLVKNAGHIPVESVLSAVLGKGDSKRRKQQSTKRKLTNDDNLRQKVVIKGSDGKENMILLDLHAATEEPVNIKEEPEDVDDPTWAPDITAPSHVQKTAWSKSRLKRARTAVRNSMKILRLPKPLKKRDPSKQDVFKKGIRKQLPITEDDPNYAVMMEKFSKPVSISTLKRHGLYQPKNGTYKINAPYKKDVAPYIEKLSDTEYKCKICLTAKFRWNYKAEIHILEHLDWRPFECDVCGRAFTQNQYLTKHKRLHFPDDTNFMCEVCGKGFQRRYYLTYHMDEHFDKTYSCQECGRKFSRRQKHDEHVRYHHKCQYSICDVCGQTLRTTALSRHRKQHGEKNQSMRKKRERSYEAMWLGCNICGRAFRSVKERDDHETEHSNALLPFQCEECVVYFKTVRSLNTHRMRCHSIPDEELEVATQEEECEEATRVLDELSTAIVVNIPDEI